MITWVLDASVVVKWALPEPARELHTNRALLILREIEAGRARVLQPPHWLAEVAAVTCRLAPARGGEVVDLLYAMELPVSDDPGLYRRACDLAVGLHEHVFDTLYHGVALSRNDTVLITADERYYRRAAHVGRIVRLAEAPLPAD